MSYECQAPGATVVEDDVERICVPYAGKPKDDSQGLITFVLFSDFQCPFCNRLVPTLQQLEKDYPGKIRFYFRHNPLPFHDNARLAAQAAVAAENQGKFWEMHDVLSAHHAELERENLSKYAQAVGLDLARFSSDLDSDQTRKRIDDDLDLARKLKVQGTPISFIDGRPVRGAVPVEEFRTIIGDELVRAGRMGAKAASAYSFYAALMKGEGKGLGKLAEAPKIPLGSEVYKIELGDAPQRGGKDPKITLVVFSDFQCPYCGRVTATLNALLKRYGDNIRVVFRHLPLPFHQRALGAALAAIAAQEQGKFWEMHDLLFANPYALDTDDLEKYASQLGLDMAKYRAAVADPLTEKRVQADLELAKTFGVGGTPTFFLNGRKFSGAYPIESFTALIDDELKRVDGLLARGTSRAELYATLVKDGLTQASQKDEEVDPDEPQPGVVYQADIKGAPGRGAKDALVTIVEYSDFQCPFCASVEPTLDRVLKQYPGKVRVVWHNFPLSFHDRARAAAIAAMAAHQQGKFWEMHDSLFAHQSDLSADDMEGYAKKIGLNMTKFRAALHDDKLDLAIAAEAHAAEQIGVRGTPAFFINGTFLSGAQPFERFKERIDEQLTQAEALLKKGTPKAKLYDVIMKQAQSQVRGPGAK